MTVGKPVTVAVTQMPPDDHLTDWVNIGVSGTVGLVAALLGAYIGYRLTKKSNDDTRQREEREKNEHAVFVMTQKLGKIYSRLTVINESVVNAAMKSENENQKYIFINARPAANKLAEVHFTTDELWRTSRIAGLEFTNDVSILDEQFNSTLSLLERYERERRLVIERLEAHGEATDGGFEFDWESPEIAKAAPHLEALDALIANMIENTEADRPRARKAIIDLHKGAGRYLKRQHLIVVNDLEGKPETIKAIDGEP
ncbi:hypothetical protein [Caulobacter sp. UC70_42]|uniref:hypothetical protein n=1 Tax=Caulobacter sp. UC70_42 TaxID=3374551 RepID=UPI003756952B